MNTPSQALLLAIKGATGWSEPKIAAEIGTSQATVNRLLNGQRGCQASTYLAIERLADRLKLTSKRRKTDKARAPAPQPQ